MMTLQDELTYLVSPRLVDNLKETYTPMYFLDRHFDSNDEAIGYMKGVMDVVNYLSQSIIED